MPLFVGGVINNCVSSSLRFESEAVVIAGQSEQVDPADTDVSVSVESRFVA